MSHHEGGDQAVQDLLVDSIGRVRGLVEDVTAGLSDADATYRPDPAANTVAWLVWHLTRVQDDHVADLAGAEQAWSREGWYDRFGLPFDPAATGYGHSSDEVAAVAVGAVLLAGYHAAVHASCLAYVERLTAAELARVVDDSWDPPVTAGARLVSVLGDCLQHLGQAAYVRGLAQRR